MEVGNVVLLKDTREKVEIVEIGKIIRHRFIDRPSDEGIRHNISDYVKSFKKKNYEK